MSHYRLRVVCLALCHCSVIPFPSQQKEEGWDNNSTLEILCSAVAIPVCAVFVVCVPLDPKMACDGWLRNCYSVKKCYK